MSEHTTPMATAYDPSQVEQKWSAYWMEHQLQRAGLDKSKEPFTIVIPPPNVTGQLHLGHALDTTIQDIVTRWQRMQGRDALWLPGTDHAGIATQAKLEEEIAKEGLTRHDLGREKFLERVWAWKDLYGSRIAEQLRRMGASCDWSRERFTFDDDLAKAVRESFVRYYEQGLIYRGTYIVNWCPHCQTVISDIEVDHDDRAGHLYYLQYPLAEGEGSVTIATTRPETMLGDVAVAVHPDDVRYKHLVGQMLVLPIVGRHIPIIADDSVDPEFGTGCVKVTPAHDPNDFAMGLKHHLPQIEVLGKDATMAEQAGVYAGMDRYDCRKQIMLDLEALGAVEKIVDHQHAVGTCSRCNAIIEPLVSEQWFVKMAPLAVPAIEAVTSGRIRFVPERFGRTYINWMENLRDWCVSRQLWWGHPIPAWTCAEGHLTVARETPTVCPVCGDTHLTQDPDVLDTWFSSALWPFSALGWPEQTEDLQRYFPTNVMMTGYDLIQFWVARMIFSSLAFMEQEPFHTVVLHGMVRDAQGRKMSKSLGNGVDPLELVENYGADAMRFMLVHGSAPGNDMRLQEDRLEGSRNFANKLWNASRFVLMNMEGYSGQAWEEENLQLPDRWILSRLQTVISDVQQALTAYDFGEATRHIYDFMWTEFCDWYIELVKPRLQSEDSVAKQTAQSVLIHVLSETLKLLHPFMPFVTEEIWQHLPIVREEGSESSIMIASWPVADTGRVDAASERTMNTLMEVVRGIRNVRAEMNVPHGRRISVLLLPQNEEGTQLAKWVAELTSRLVQAGTMEHIVAADIPTQAMSVAVSGLMIYLPLADLVDLDMEKARLAKEIASVEQDIMRIEGKLSNESFVAKAPADVVDKEKQRLDDAKTRLAGLVQRLAQFNA